jgi:hypothetical protein
MSDTTNAPSRMRYAPQIINMNEIKFLKAYLLYTFVGVLAGAVAGAIQGALLGAVLGILSYADNIPLITGITGFLVGIVISFFVFRWSIQKFILTQLTVPQA